MQGLYEMKNVLYGQTEEYEKMLSNVESMCLNAKDEAEAEKCFSLWKILLQIHGARTPTSEYFLKQLAKDENRDIISIGSLLHLDTSIQSCTNTPSRMEEEDAMGRKDVTYHIDGVTYRATGKTDAEVVENAVMRHAAPTPLQTPSPLFGDYAMNWETTYHVQRLKGGSSGAGALNNRGLYKNHIMPALGEKHLNEITTDMLQAFFNKKAADGFSKSTIDQMYLLINGVLQHAYENELVSRNVAQSKSIVITGTKEDREALSTQQVKTLVSRLERLELQDRLMVALPLFTGLRRGEFIGLTWENIDMEQRVLYVRQGMNATYKGNQAQLGKLKSKSAVRTVGLIEPLVQMLEQCPRKEGFVIGGGSQPITQQTYKRAVERIRKQLDTDFHFAAHILRHTFATFGANGLDIKDLQVIMGHSDIQTTGNIYVHGQPEKIKKNRDAMNTVFVQLFSDIPQKIPQDCEAAKSVKSMD